jgi:hypothetical protein
MESVSFKHSYFPRQADAKAGAEQLIANSAEALIVDLPVEINKLELAAVMGNIPFVTLDIDGGELFPSFRVDHIRGSRFATRLGSPPRSLWARHAP